MEIWSRRTLNSLLAISTLGAKLLPRFLWICTDQFGVKDDHHMGLRHSVTSMLLGFLERMF